MSNKGCCHLKTTFGRELLYSLYFWRYPRVETGAHHCNDFYISKTRRRLHDRKTEHFKALVKNGHTSAIADHVKTTGHNIKWDHFDILASGKTDYHCKIKETLLIQELKPAFNVNVSSEKLMLYELAGAFYRFTVKIAFLILVPDPLSLLYKRFVKIATVTFENVC